MILYHGSNLEIVEIDLSLCRPYKDFGKGFYTTESPEQAQKMAKRVVEIYGGTPVVNIYEINDDFLSDENLNVLNFGRVPSKHWALFVINNRSREYCDFLSPECNFDNKYDIVCGPIMTFREVTNQYSFHTEKAIKLLKKIGVKYY